MKIFDRVYGKEEVNESVFVDLINSKPVQRLKGLNQYGIPDEYYHKKNFLRYDHSMGVFILLRKLGADLDEQIAGLLHDVSHTAFSHVIDLFMGDPTKEDYQDSIHSNFITESEIPSILERYKIETPAVNELKNFSLLDKEAPSLCVDRVDYTLRELKEEWDPRIINQIIDDLVNFRGQLVFKTKSIAELFAEKYSYLQNTHWSGDQARARYHILSEILRIAMENKIISMDAFKLRDNEVINLLVESKNPSILRRLDLLKKGFEIVESSQGIELKKKFRHIDPEVLNGNSFPPLSKLSKDYFDFIEKEKLNLKSSKKVMILEK
jgi:HD superfamily phosphohydrolase